MMKKIIMAALALMLLCGCGGTAAKAPYTLDAADTVLNSGAFEGSEMAPLDSAVIPMLYGIDSAAITECAAYMAVNTSVSADELVVLICTDEDAAMAAEEACKARVESQIAVCESYAPAAVPRLEKAFISRRGSTVLMVVGDPAVIAGLKELQ